MLLAGTCSQCNYISSQEICKACVLLDGLNRGLPRLAVAGKQRKINKVFRKDSSGTVRL